MTMTADARGAQAALSLARRARTTRLEAMKRDQEQTPQLVAGVTPTGGARARAVSELDAMLQMGRRNLDALSAIRTLTVDSIYQCADAQAQAWDALCQGAFDLMAGNAARTASFEAAGFNQVIEAALGHLRQLSEIIARTNHGAVDLIHNRSTAYLRAIEEVAGPPAER